MLGATTVPALMAIRLLRLRRDLDGTRRKVFPALGTGVVLRHLYWRNLCWRATSTLPSVTDPVSFACGLTLCLAELHSIGMLFISLFVIAGPVDRPLICGLQPETFASFIGQRSRWCRGMSQILLLTNPPFERGLTLAQRICYLSNMTCWLFPLIGLPFLVAPFLYIWFSLRIHVANLHELVSHAMIHMAANVLMQNTTYGRVRWPFASELYEFMPSILLCRGLVSVVLNPRKPTFNVTDKGNTLERDFLSELALPCFVIAGRSW